MRIDEIGPLRACLTAALKSGRTVIVTADHGHVVDYDVQYRRSPKSGERSRPATGEAPGDGEILLEGPRVLLPTNRAIVPWTERVRYATGRSAGYHGGVSLQEMVVPISILIPAGTKVKGLDRATDVMPDWWSVGGVVTP